MCLDDCSRNRRSSARAAAPVNGWGDSLGDSPRGDFVRCVPNVAPPELRAVGPGVDGALGALKGPLCVGVIARVVADMVTAMTRLARG